VYVEEVLIVQLNIMKDRQVISDELSFFIGVTNVMFSSWFIGAYPFAYWILHSVKIVVLLVLRLIDFSKRKLQFWLLDYCYVINYLILIYYLLSVAGVCPYPKVVFRILFTSCVGPLALSIPAFRNSLVFHSTDQIVILAVHWSPNVAMWGMRWWSERLKNHFGDAFDIGCSEISGNEFKLFFDKDGCPATFSEIYGLPVFLYVICWATPYYLFFFIFAAKALKRNGYYTMFEDMVKTNSIIKKVVNLGGSKAKEVKYMLAHGCCAYLSFFMGPLLWHSFALHTIYLIFIMSISIYNGGTFYFRVFAKKYYKDMIALEVERLNKEALQLKQRAENEEKGLVNEDEGDDDVDTDTDGAGGTGRLERGNANMKAIGNELVQPKGSNPLVEGGH
jgi:hypothetical protein